MGVAAKDMVTDKERVRSKFKQARCKPTLVRYLAPSFVDGPRGIQKEHEVWIDDVCWGNGLTPEAAWRDARERLERAGKL